MSLFDQIAQQHYAAPPEGWQTKKIKFLADIQTSNVDKLTDEDEEAVRLCNYTDVYYNDRITPDLPFMEATATPKEIEKFTLQAGQVFITKDSEGWDDIGIPALVTEDMPGVLCGYHLAIFTPDSDKLEGAFLAWLCRADALNDQFKLSANGVTRFGLGQYSMKNAVVGYPPLETQKRIAAFLDEKTAQIDALIARKQGLLERLAEKRQAIITQAVTKGLNPAAPLKDSGINWLGQIPAHWETKRLKYVSPRVTVGIVVTPAAHYADEGTLALRGLNIKTMDFDLSDTRNITHEGHELNRKSTLRKGDLVAVRTGAPGTTAVITKELAGCNCIDLVIIRRPNNADSRYIGWYLNSDIAKTQYGMGSEGALQQHFNVETSKEVVLSLPPLDEQREISAYIDAAMIAHDRQRGMVDDSIAKLIEYRSALITSAVTGQIKGLQ